MDYLDSLKNTINDTLETVTKLFVPPPKETCFYDKGMLTPDEFI